MNCFKYAPALFKLMVFLILIVAANYAAHWISETLKLEIRPSNEDEIHQAIVVSAILYTVIIALPFVPGVEIGLTLLAMLGPPIVALVYVCTLLGLTASFVIGRLVSPGILIETMYRLKLDRAGRLLQTVEPMSREERLSFLVSRAPSRMIPFLLRHRYIALAIVINLPGNILLGGGGGISLLAGVSRLYPLSGFITLIALAVLPVPLAVLLFGVDAVYH